VDVKKVSWNCEECVWLYFLQEAVQVWSLVPKRNQFEVPKEAISISI